MTGLTEILKGANGNYEINRVVGALGGLSYIVAAPAFMWWHMSRGAEFDVTAFCLAYAGGLATLGIGTGAAVALKDRNVAHAKVVSETGSRPADPPAPAPKVQPELATTADESDLPEYARA